MQLLTYNRGEVSCSDEYTAAQALRLLSGPSRSELRRRWSLHTHQEITDDTREIMDASEIVEEAREIMEDAREAMDANREVTDGTMRTPSPTCC
jgi:hypothetical protein